MKIHVEDPVVKIAQLFADGSFLFPGFDFHLTHLIYFLCHSSLLFEFFVYVLDFVALMGEIKLSL